MAHEPAITSLNHILGNVTTHDTADETLSEHDVLQVVGANSMNIILRHMNEGTIDLSEYTVPVLSNLKEASNFLQVTPLIEQIENYLTNLELTVSNCMVIMDIAEQISDTKLEHSSSVLGLLSFKSMKPDYIPSIDRLFWYLSHPYLDTDSELDVFKFGFDWISKTKTGSDGLLILLGCLDVKRLTSGDLKQIFLLTKEYDNSLAKKVIICLDWLCNNEDITLETVTTKKSTLCESFTERVYLETYNIVKGSKERKLKYTPVIHSSCHLFICKYTDEKGVEILLDMPKKNLNGWNLVAWGNTKLVVVCGEYQGFRSKTYMKDVLIYDTLRKEWINHGVELPERAYGHVAVLDDSLFIVGGYHEKLGLSVLNTAILYNLKERTYKEIADPPEEGFVHLCNHKGTLYAIRYSHKIYAYEDSEQLGGWRLSIMEKRQDNHLIYGVISFNGYIYSCTSNKCVLRCRPEIDNSWEEIRIFHTPSAFCSLKTHLLVFVHTLECEREFKPVGYWEYNFKFKVRSMYRPQVRSGDFDGSCLLVIDLPSSLRLGPSKYHQKLLSNYLKASITPKMLLM